MGQPARVELAAEDGDAALEPRRLGELLLVRTGVEPDGRAGEAPRFKHIGRGSVGRVERHLDPGLLPEPLERQHVVPVVPVAAVFVLDLDHEHRTAALDLEVPEDLAELQNVRLARGEIARVGATDLDVRRPQEPGRQPAEVPLGAGVGPGPDDDPQPDPPGGPDERSQIVPFGEVPLPGLGLEGVPEDVGPDRVEAGGLELDQPVGPVLPRDALVMDLAGHDPERLAVEEKVLVPQPEIPLLAGEAGGQGQDDQGGERLSEESHAALPSDRVIGARRFYHTIDFPPPADIIHGRVPPGRKT